MGTGNKIDTRNDRIKRATARTVANLDGKNAHVFRYSVRRTPKRSSDVRAVAVEVIVAAITSFIDEIGSDCRAPPEIDMGRANARVNHISRDACTGGVIDILI